MLRIAFCDDDVSVLNELSDLTDRYCSERNYEIEYAAYHSPLELIARIEKGLRFDILFLDVIMPGVNGIEIAKEIRTYDENVKIIFLTFTPEFALQSYTVGAYLYQLKPVEETAFYSVMNQVIETCRQSLEKKLVLKCKDGITAIPVTDIEFCEVIGHNLVFHMKNGKVYESVGKMNELETKLEAFGCFLRIHRSYLANMDYIQNISYRTVKMNCLTEIPIPHGKYNDIKKVYLAYMFEKESIVL